MHFTCTYKSGAVYGTGEKSTDYIASVTTEEDEVTLAIYFNYPPQGKSHTKDNPSAVKSLAIRFSRKESLQIAASIIAQAHHPSIHDSVAMWIPPESMAVLKKNQWCAKLKVAYNKWHKEIYVDNKSNYHVGRIEFEICYRINSGSQESDHKARIWKLIDLPPSVSRSVKLDEDEIPFQHRKSFDELLDAVPITVTGLVPGISTART